MGGLTNTKIHAHTTGRRRPIGCLKLQVIFRKSATNHMVFLRKMTYKDKASYGSSSPCISLLREDYTYFRGHFIYTHTRTISLSLTHTHTRTGGNPIGRNSEGRLQLRPGTSVAR